MKKYFLSIVALAAMLLATSCQESLVEPQMEGPTTFTVQVPDAMGTKAIGEASSVNKLFVEVYSNGTSIFKKTQDINGSTTVSLDLIKGQTYQIVFWAQKGDSYVKEGDALAEISIPTDFHNNESGAAFYAYETFEIDGKAKSVTLRRPFAQLNLGTTEASLTTNAGGVELQASKVTFVTETATKFNTLLGKGTDPSQREYSANISLFEGEKLTLANGDEYVYVSMDYLPVVDNKAVVELGVEIKTNLGTITHNFTNVPIQKNYRTNIVGNLISSSTDFNVVVDNKFNGELPQTAEDKLRMAAQVGGEFTLTENITLTQPLEVKANMILDLNDKTIDVEYEEGSQTKHIYAFENYANLTIKGNGIINARGIFNYGVLTLENGTINAIDGNGGYAVRNYEGSEFIMNGGTVAATYEDGDAPTQGYDATPIRVDAGAEAVINAGIVTNSNNYTFAIDNAGTTTINGGTITSVHTTVTNYATMTINGGEFSCNGLEGITAHVLWAAGGTVNIYGGSFDGKDNYNGFNVDASTGSVVNIYGGEFLPVHSGSLYGEGTITVSGGTFFDNPSAARLADGYKVINNGEKYYVVKEEVDNIATTNEDLKEALKSSDVVYVVEGDYTFPASSIKAGQTIICEEGTVFTGTSSLNIQGSTVIGATFKNETGTAVTGTINGTFKNCYFKGKNALSGCYVYADEPIIFEDCTFEGDDYTFHFDDGSENSKIICVNCIFNSDWRVAIGAGISLFEAIDCEFNVRGFINFWGNVNLENCEFTRKPEYWIRNLDKGTYTDCLYLGRPLDVEDITIDEFIIINNEYYVSGSEALKSVMNEGVTKIHLTDAQDYDLNSIQKDGLTLIGIGENIKVANTTNYAGGGSVGAIWKAINLENVTITNTVFTMDEGSNATFKNVYFEKGVRQAYGNNVKFESCSFGSNSEGYALHFQTDVNDNGNITIDRCQFNGGKVHLGGKRTYDFKECNFEAGTDFQVWSNITLENCSVDGTIVTSANIATLFPNLDLNKVTIK